MGNRNMKCVLLFSIKEWKAIEPDHAVCNTTFGEQGGNSFCRPYYNLRKQIRLAEKVAARGEV